MKTSPTDFLTSSLAASAYAVAIYLFALAVSSQLVRIKAIRGSLSDGGQRVGCLDGLRGVLALGVLMHHSVTAWVYQTTGSWAWSNSPIMNQLGQATVAMFFMITGFLFAAKSRKAPVDWGRFYRQRVARLAPLYLTLVVVLFAVVLGLSGGLRESPGAVAREFANWAAFVVFGRPDINGYDKSWTLIAGVNWSLKYEVLFYIFAFPALHLLFRRASARLAFASTFLALAGMLFVRWHDGFTATATLFWTHFLCGILTAYAFEVPTARAIVTGRRFRWVALLAFLLLTRLTYSYNNIGVLAIALVFAAVAGGASMFGLLRTRAAIWLGDVSYGIYLLHGLMLWTLLRATARWTDLHALSAFDMLPLAFGAAFCAVVLASLSYVFLELPIMRRAARHRPALPDASRAVPQ